MKHIFIVLLTFFAYSHNIFSMNQTTRQSLTGMDEMVSAMNQAINKQYSYNYGEGLDALHATLTIKPEDFLSILAMPRKCYPNINLSNILLEKLSGKNIFFKKAIQHFTSIARKKFEQVTADTLNNIDSSTILHQFPECLALYIINCAQAQAPYTYTMYLESGTGAEIIDYDVCSKTDSAVISFGDTQVGYTLQFWDLKTAQPIHTFDEKKYVSSVGFNTSGTQLAANIRDEEKSHIKIWNAASKIILHTISHAGDCYYLGYNIHPDRSVLSITPLDSDECYQYLIKEKKYTYLGHSNDCFTLMPLVTQKNIRIRDTYTMTRVVTPFITSHLCIRKTGCHEMDLCNRAIDKARTEEELVTIKISNPYLKLTPYEKKRMNKEVKGKRKKIQK
jgi:hypothetical protein